MSTGTTLQISSDSLEATEQLAAAIGGRLRGGEVIALSSDLGGGKTAFVRGLARGMGSPDHVASPTFTIGREYYAASKDITIYHFDFYRLQEAGIMSDELVEILNNPRAVSVIEWGAVVENVLPERRLSVDIIRTGETSRTFTFIFPPELNYVVEPITS